MPCSSSPARRFSGRKNSFDCYEGCVVSNRAPLAQLRGIPALFSREAFIVWLCLLGESILVRETPGGGGEQRLPKPETGPTLRIAPVLFTFRYVRRKGLVL